MVRSGCSSAQGRVRTEKDGPRTDSEERIRGAEVQATISERRNTVPHSSDIPVGVRTRSWPGFEVPPCAAGSLDECCQDQVVV